MSDIKSFEPLWGSWQTTELIGEGSFGKVYRAERIDYGKTYYAAIKHISIPANENQKNEAIEYGLADGYDELCKYFASIAENLMQEIILMYEVKGNTNIVSYEDHLTIPKPDGIGCDIFIRMELLTGLNEVIRNTSLPESEVIKLGIDMCNALEVCAAKNIIHRDIKPANIFIGANNEYKLGDFGIARRLENTTIGMSKKGTYAYMPPEIYHGEPANLTADIYSLGLVMYRLLNDNRAPFTPKYPAPITAIDHEKAILERITGGSLPAPAHASTALSNVITKATQFNIRQRFSTPREFKDALIQVQNGETLDELTIPATNEDYENESTQRLYDFNGTLTSLNTETIPITATPKEYNSERSTPPQPYSNSSTHPNDDTITKTSKKPVKAMLRIGAAALFLIICLTIWLTVLRTPTGYVEINGELISTDVTELDLTHCKTVNANSITQCKNLKTLDIRGIDIDRTDIDSLMEALPDCEILWTIPLYGKEFNTTASTINLDNTNIDSLNELESSLKYFSNLRTVKLADTSLDNETLHEFNQTHDTFIEWIVKIGNTETSTSIQNLTITGDGLTDISNIKYCTKLEQLDLGLSDDYLYSNNISDITPLAKLTKLKFLDLSGNIISDISPLENLTDLRNLDLSENNISDISPLKNLTSLTYLNLTENKINDVSPLANLTNLRDLYLYDNMISDISCLSNLTNLRSYFLGGNSISDISTLSNMTNLEDLDLTGLNINDIKPITNLTKLNYLYLYNCNITEKQKMQLDSALPSCNILY